MHIVLILLLVVVSRRIDAAHIGIFASPGYYSHDVLARNLADRLVIDYGHRVTIIQIRMFEFNRTLPAPKAHWDHISYNASDTEAASLQLKSQRMLWQTTLPVDPDNFEFESVRLMNKIQAYQMRACSSALRDEEFIEKLKHLNLDLLILDYLVNVCGLGFTHAHMPNVKLTHFSNFPLVSSYLQNFGISSIPSYVPAVIGSEPSRMNVFRRLVNTGLYGLLVLTRVRFYASAQRAFRSAIDHELPKLNDLESGMLVFGTPMEMLVDTPRPVVSGLKYFGCEHCGGGLEPIGNISQLLHIQPGPLGYIVVSFGTIVDADQIPLEKLIHIWSALASIPDYAVIWQTDSRRERYESAVLRALNTSALPKHVHLFSWVPLRAVLRDRKVALAIVHGGVSTCMEAVRAGVPVLGLAIQGDQQYNLQRLVERDVAQVMKASSLNRVELLEKMQYMLMHRHRYKQSAIKLRDMIDDHKSLETRSSSAFWMNWAVQHFGVANPNLTTWADSLVHSRHSRNWLMYYNSELYVILGAIIAVVWKVLV